MRFDIVTLFPDFFSSPLSSGLLAKALAKQIASVHLIDPRNFATDKHRRVDDETYGGGVGMLMKPEPIFGAVESLPVSTQTRNDPDDAAGRTDEATAVTRIGNEL